MTDDVLAVSPREAARRSGLGRTTVYAAITDGSLPSFKVGARRLVRLAALDNWLAGHERCGMNACEQPRSAVETK